MTRRGTVSSAVSPVGPDLVGSSVAERERAPSLAMSNDVPPVQL